MSYRTSSLAYLLSCVLAAACWAQRPDPVKWTLQAEPSTVAPGGPVVLRMKGTVQPGYHIYSLSTPPGGPNRTTVALADTVALQNTRVYQPAFQTKFDEGFKIDVQLYAGDAEFLMPATVSASAASGPVALTAQVRYQACTETTCLPPVRRSATTTLTVQSGAAAGAAFTPPAGYTEFTGPATLVASEPAAVSSGPVASATSDASGGLVQFLLVAFGLGLAAIFTPCVFPMIPITMSVFLNRESATRGEVLRQAGLFCLGIIVLFTGMGALVTAVAGPFGVVQLASNPWVNGLIASVFIVFGLSLLGAFEITLPSGLLTRLNTASGSGGVAGTLLMGLTFSLTSFACVGPFVGTLLAASVQGQGWQPLLGMMAFATGLASPFFLLALFPSFLQKLPRSGGWLARVKVVLGFVILAAALKYLSSIDQVLQTNFLTRERFLAAWVVLFMLPGLYLLGLLRLEGIKADEPVGLGRLLAGALFLVFSVSLVPGMLGAKLGDLDAYVPFATGTVGTSSPSASGQGWLKNQYREALDLASQQNKLVLVSFTGYACTNCHWMKANMFPRPAVAEALQKLVVVELYTDGTDASSEQNQSLQESRFASVAVPLYAVLDAKGNVISTANYTRDEQAFLAFLRSQPRG